MRLPHLAKISLVALSVCMLAIAFTSMPRAEEKNKTQAEDLLKKNAPDPVKDAMKDAGKGQSAQKVKKQPDIQRSETKNK